MLLSEALRASKTRHATGHLLVGELKLPIAFATDTFVTYTVPVFHSSGDVSLGDPERRAWSDLLPGTMELLDALDWEPNDPKSALTRLAEAVDDWQEDS